ncbi:hypothetical protein B0T14DRAFT_186923 [Immersiella caudata]|uniref:Uncharacterized protein n=1 Tax=Immersiella caudata TaxID=314043 RepID=A0AA39WXZ9_9PEZI|nr:hypothetical protein B0T14DRAFT_186923 [Immersiella caudata]
MTDGPVIRRMGAIDVTESQTRTAMKKSSLCLTNSTPDPGCWSRNLPAWDRSTAPRPPACQNREISIPPADYPSLAGCSCLLNDAKPQTSETRLDLRTRLGTSFCSVAATEPVDLCFAPCLVSKPHFMSCRVVASLLQVNLSAPGTLRLGDARPSIAQPVSYFLSLRPCFRSKTPQFSSSPADRRPLEAHGSQNGTFQIEQRWALQQLGRLKLDPKG